MKAKTLLLGALLGGAVMFIWGAFAHMGLNPLWEMTMKPLPNEQAVVDVLKSAGAANGMYYGMSGIFMTLFLKPGVDPMANMGPLMIIEFISVVVASFVLTLLLLWTNLKGLVHRALFAGGIALACWINVNVSYWNWYSFSCGYVMLEALDAVVGFFLAGLVIAWLMRKFEPAHT